MIQYNMNQGLKRSSKSRVSAIEKEVRQLVTMDALETDDPKDLNREDHRAVMVYLMLLKEKREAAIKSKGCCDGIMQRNYMTK